MVRMRPSHRFALSRANEENYTCGLTRDGVGIAETFDGTLLDAQYDLPDSRSVLCLGYASLDDAGFNIYLTSADGAIEDAIGGGTLFLSGGYEERRVGDGTLDFKFFDNDIIYRLSVLPQSRFRFFLPRPWHYKHRLRPHQLMLNEHSTYMKADDP